MNEDYKKIALEDVKKGQRIRVVMQYKSHIATYEGEVVRPDIERGEIEIGVEGNELPIYVVDSDYIGARITEILLLEDSPKPKVVRTEWFDKNYSVWVDSSDQARRAKESNMSKKINAGDTLTVDDLTEDYIGAVIEVGPVDGFTTRLNLDKIVDSSAISTIRVLCSKERASRGFYGITPVTVITPPPSPRQPDEPTAFGQCIRLEDDGEVLGVVADPGDPLPIRTFYYGWMDWDNFLSKFGDSRLVVSDPPRWPDETPVVPERIEKGEWPADDTHLRGWEWHTVDDRFGDDHTARWNDQESQWECLLCATVWRRGGQRKYVWTRGERVE